MKLRLFCVCDAFIATQSHVCLNVKTSRRLLSIEISLCSVFAASNALSENQAAENSKGNRIFLYSVRNALQSS